MTPRRRSHLALAALSAAVATALPAQAPAGSPAPSPATGFTAGVALGISRVNLRSLAGLPAASGTDIALSWSVGYRTSQRTAVVLKGASSPYRYTGPGRRRRRAFEGIFPSFEYRVTDDAWVSAGAGLNLDAPVFYDVRGRDPNERRFSRGLGTLLSVGYGPFRSSSRSLASSVFVEGRWQFGFNDVPDGRQYGQTAALLVGLRRR